jgi:HEAT repeat protein
VTVPDDRAQAAEELLQEVIRAFKVRRLYEGDHPQRAAIEGSATARIAAILEERGALELALEDGEARLEDRTLSTGAGDTSVVSILYHEGIREIVFQPGLTAGELARFLDHVAEVAAVAAGERDLLARLWEETLPHIHYVFVERLADHEWTPDVAEPPAEEATAAGPVVLEPDDRLALGMPVVSLPDPTAYRLTDGELAGLQAELEGEKARTLLHETLTCLRELLLDPPHDDPTPVVGAIADIQGRLLGEGRLAEVRGLHDLFVSYLDSPRRDPRVVEAFALLRRAAVDGAALARLVERLDEGHATEEELTGYLSMLGPEELPALLVALPETKRLCQRPAVGAVLEGLAARNPQALRDALAGGDEAAAGAAAYLAGTTGDLEMGPAFQAALGRPEPRVRLEAIQALKHLGDGGVPYAAGAVEDADPAVRVYALRHLIAHRFEPAFPAVAALFDRIDQEGRSLAERRLVYEAFGALGGSRAVDELARRMGRRGVFRKGDPEVATCAIVGLAATGSPVAREIVEEAARDRDDLVRGAARSALQTWHRSEAGSAG